MEAVSGWVPGWASKGAGGGGGGRGGGGGGGAEQGRANWWWAAGAVLAVVAWQVAAARQRRRHQPTLPRCAASAAAAREVLCRHAAGLPVSPMRPLRNWVYGHGGGMGAGVEVLRQPAWAAAVEALSPSYWDLLLRAAGGMDAVRRGAPLPLPAGRILAIMENNPVMAAFGVAHAARAAYPAAPVSRGVNRLVLEWDVYLDLDAAGALLARASAPGAGADIRAACAARLAMSTLVAHGGLWHWVQERVLGWNAFAGVQRDSGGLRLADWVPAFAGALATCAPDVRIGDAGVDAGTVGGHTPTVALSVFLDIKSTGASPPLLALLTEGLNAAGIHVWGVGSFRAPQLAALVGAAPPTQHVARGVWRALAAGVAVAGDGAGGMGGGAAHPPPAPATVDLPPPLAIHLFTCAGEVQAAHERGGLPHGAAILFNGSSLLRRTRGGGFEAHDAVVRELGECVRRHAWRVGYYTQEPSLHAAAADVLAALADAHPDTFALGFAYGGVAGAAEGGIPPPEHEGDLPGMVAPWGLARFAFRRWRLAPPAAPAV